MPPSLDSAWSINRGRYDASGFGAGLYSGHRTIQMGGRWDCCLMMNGCTKRHTHLPISIWREKEGTGRRDLQTRAV